MAYQSLFSLVEIPFILAAVLLGFHAARHHTSGLVRRGLVFLVIGLIVMAIGHAHMLVQHQAGINLAEEVLGGTGGTIAWLAALAASWSLTAYGFRCVTASSLVDALTGIGNRRQFDLELDQAFRRAARTGSRISLLLLDVDNFKAFNDHYGHREGDRCLRSVAQCLEATAKRATDIVCRYGGEEFVVVVTDDDNETVAQFAETLRRAVEELDVEHAASPFRKVTICVGAATCSSKGACSDDLIRAADRALYAAKEQGRNQIQIATPETFAGSLPTGAAER